MRRSPAVRVVRVALLAQGSVALTVTGPSEPGTSARPGRPVREGPRQFRPGSRPAGPGASGRPGPEPDLASTEGALAGSESSLTRRRFAALFGDWRRGPSALNRQSPVQKCRRLGKVVAAQPGKIQSVRVPPRHFGQSVRDTFAPSAGRPAAFI